ncbi:Cytoplasmic FMR1-interacting protein [Bulinus truncatus]|nr:Cytoplasmic FMR1-interacting protein [Bulinus truncatus]
MAASNPGSGQPDGWNDPPVLNFNSTPLPVSSRAPRLQLNKRVSFPLNSPTTNQTPVCPQDPDSAGMLLSPKSGPLKLPPVQILPPSASTSVNPPVPLLVPLSPPIDHSGLPPSFISAVRDPQRSETLPELLERLDLDSGDALRKYTKRVLHEMVDLCQDSIQGRSRDDVQARLGILDDQWRDDKLSEGAKIKLGCLACALQQKDLKQADSLHLALMVDHITEVSQWMVGVKRLINEIKLSASSLSASLSKKTPPPETSVSESSVDAPDPQQDFCIDTVQFSNLKPVLLPEDLMAPTEGDVSKQQLHPNQETADPVMASTQESVIQQSEETRQKKISKKMLYFTTTMIGN